MTVKEKIQSLLDSANDATGESHSNLTDAVASLIAGQGGGQTVYYGNPSESYGDAYPYVPILTFPYDALPSKMGRLHYLEEVHAPEYTGTFSANFFYGCERLKLADFPKATRADRGSLFRECTSLETVYFPHSSTFGTALSFLGCTALRAAQFGSVGYPVVSDYASSNIFPATTNNFEITLYVPDDAVLPYPYQPWGATNSTVIYRSATTGEVIPVE